MSIYTGYWEEMLDISPLKKEIPLLKTKNSQLVKKVARNEKSFSYHFSFHYINLTYHTFHSPNMVKAGWPAPWNYIDQPYENTKVKVLGHVFDGDTDLSTFSRLKMEYKVFVSLSDKFSDDAILFYNDIKNKAIADGFFIGV